MSEETRRARKAVPRSIFYTVVTNGILAYGMVICILFTMGPIENAQNSDFPIIEICTQATGSVRAATAMVCGLLVISLSVTLASIASASRLTWAWARDGALPKWFAYVSTVLIFFMAFIQTHICEYPDRPKTQRPRARRLATCVCGDVSRMSQHRRLSGLSSLRGAGLNRAVRVVLYCDRLYGAQPLPETRCAAGRVEHGRAGPPGQHLRARLHGLGHCLACVPDIPPRHGREHELCIADLWCVCSFRSWVLVCEGAE